MQDRGSPALSAAVTSQFVVGGQPSLAIAFNNEPIVLGVEATDSKAYFGETPVVISARYAGPARKLQPSQ